TVYGYPGYLTMTGKNVVVRYRPGDQADAGLVLAGAEEYYGRVMADFGVSPTGRVPVVVYPTATSLNNSFGWAGDLNAMGAYWAGVIRVVAPSTWIDVGSPQVERDIFFDEGPMAHELTHFAVDELTGGNCPRWLQEGLAQWEEMQLTGFQLPPPDSGTWYSMDDLSNHFDSLTDQSAAYYQSLAAVTYMYKHFGPDQVTNLLHRLRAGESMEQAMSGTLGEKPADFAVQYQKFAAANLD
ncbi:MAG TPA: hypothetical protein VMW83_07215, partial [Spirochaetia bacterium]|nr:hypothetical protein [Spirochaetia bacterium]